MNMQSPIHAAPHPTDVYVGQKIRQRRKILGLSMEALGKKLGLTFQQIQKYESGKNRVSASRLAPLAEALGVPISYFFPELGANGAMPDRYDLAAAVAGLRATLKQMDASLADIARRAG